MGIKKYAAVVVGLVKEEIAEFLLENQNIQMIVALILDLGLLCSKKRLLYMAPLYLTGEQQGDSKAIMAYANDAVFKDKNLRTAANNNSQVKLKGKKYYVGEGKKRYLWLATRMGIPTVKDAPGIEVVQTYNLLTHDQIVGEVMKKLV